MKRTQPTISNATGHQYGKTATKVGRRKCDTDPLLQLARSARATGPVPKHFFGCNLSRGTGHVARAARGWVCGSAERLVSKRHGLRTGTS